jgi:hypothetical protein
MPLIAGKRLINLNRKRHFPKIGFLRGYFDFLDILILNVPQFQ